MARILQLEFGALAAENRADPLRKGSSLLGMCAHCRIACPEVVGSFGVDPRGYSICPGKVSPGFVDGDDGTRLVDNRYVRGEAVQGSSVVLAAPGFLLPGGLLASYRAEQLESADHSLGEPPKHPHLVLTKLDGLGVQQAEGADGVTIGGDERRPRVKVDAVVHAPVLLPELFGSQKILHNERHLTVHHVLAHAVLEGVLPGFGQFRGQLSRPGPEVLHLGKAQVHHAEIGAEYATHFIDQLLKDVISLGSYCIQVIQRRKSLRFADIIIKRRSVELFLVYSRTWGHVNDLLSAVAYRLKIIIQMAAAERSQDGGDPSATDLVSGVGTLNK